MGDKPVISRPGNIYPTVTSARGSDCKSDTSSWAWYNYYHIVKFIACFYHNRGGTLVVFIYLIFTLHVCIATLWSSGYISTDWMSILPYFSVFIGRDTHLGKLIHLHWVLTKFMFEVLVVKAFVPPFPCLWSVCGHICQHLCFVITVACTCNPAWASQYR